MMRALFRAPCQRQQRPESRHFLRTESGFTLIEIIASLILIALIGSLGTIGITSFVQSFTLSQQAADIAAKAQLASQRITKEIVAITSVSSSSPSSITFTSVHKDGNHTYTLSLSGTDLLLTSGGSSDVLADEVSSFGIKYFEWYNYPSAGQPNLQETTSSPYWHGPSTCPSITYSITKHYKPTCDYQNSPSPRQEFNLVFRSSSTGPFNVRYGSGLYTVCTVGSYPTKYYTVRGDLSTNLACTYGNKQVVDLYSSSTDDIYYYDKAYIYPTSQPECYIAIDVENGFSSSNTWDDCKIGPVIENEKPLPTSAGAKLIQIKFSLSGSSEEFVVEAAPRNIPIY